MQSFPTAETATAASLPHRRPCAHGVSVRLRATHTRPTRLLRCTLGVDQVPGTCSAGQVGEAHWSVWRRGRVNGSAGEQWSTLQEFTQARGQAKKNLSARLLAHSRSYIQRRTLHKPSLQLQTHFWRCSRHLGVKKMSASAPLDDRKKIPRRLSASSFFRTRTHSGPQTSTSLQKLSGAFLRSYQVRGMLLFALLGSRLQGEC